MKVETTRSGGTTSRYSPLNGCSWPSGPRRTKRQEPPGRTSISQTVSVEPCGPHHRFRCSGLLIASKTSRRGAPKSRVRTISRSEGNVTWRPAGFSSAGFAASRSGDCAATAPVLRFAAVTFLLLSLKFVEVIAQAVEALFPEPAVLSDPIRDLPQRLRVEAAGPPLRPPALRDQAGALQHLEVLGHGGQGHVERLGELLDRGLARGEPREDRAAGRVGEGREGGAELVGRHRIIPSG